MSQACITIKKMTMAYGEFIIQRDLDFKINQGDIFVIMGGSGCGKSTLMMHLIGMIAPSKGAFTMVMKICGALMLQTRDYY